MEEIKAEDIRFGKTDSSKGKRPTDIMISNRYSLDKCGEIYIVINPGNVKPFSLEKIYYITSKKFHYFNLKGIKNWKKIKEITFKRFYRPGTDKRLRMDDFVLTVCLDKDGPRILRGKN